VFTDTNNTLRLFRAYLVTLTAVLVMFGVPDLGPRSSFAPSWPSYSAERDCGSTSASDDWILCE